MMRFLGDVLKNTLTSMFLTMYEKICNIVLTMHISDVFGNTFKRNENCSNYFEICDKLLVSLSGLSENIL